MEFTKDSIDRFFWSKDKNFWQPRFNWIVNFLNGNTFGRYPDYKPNYIRLVRDRN